ncbi:AbrB/MazE/SpoVT family DNA-binding domain-containing protein [Planctomycetota bacterium]
MRTEETQMSVHQVKIDTSGRIVLPAALRERLGVDVGDSVMVIDDDGSIVIRSYADAMQRLQNAFCDGIPEGVSLASELIAERTIEAQHEVGH